MMRLPERNTLAYQDTHLAVVLSRVALQMDAGPRHGFLDGNIEKFLDDWP